jgi:RNA polymerase sigma factor (TIGR02999 family)
MAETSGQNSGRTPGHELAVTILLRRWQNGDADALQSVIAALYQQLKALADTILGQETPETRLRKTELLHETYLRLVRVKSIDWRSRAQFFQVAAKLMRQVLIDRARERLAAKRGGGFVQVPLDDALSEIAARQPDDSAVLAVIEALEQLRILDRQQADIVECRFLAGLSVEETAELLGISSRTVKRDWRFSKAWLRRRIAGSHP